MAHVDKIEWGVEQYTQKGEAVEVNKNGVDATSEDPIRHVGVVYGRISVSDKNYRVSVAQVNKIIATLEKNERIEKVEAIEMPVEVRSEKTFTDESGLNAKLNSNSEKGKFALQITMKAAEHES